MTIKLGLTIAELAAYELALCYPHRMRSIVTVRDNNEKLITSFKSSAVALSGAVQVDATADVTRQLSLSLVKPGAQTSWAPQAPDDAAIFADNFVSATRGIYVDALARWVDVPIFWGPVVSADDDGDQINVTASGKELRGRAPYALWQTMHIGAGMQRTVAIRQVLDAIGETRYVLPEHSSALGKAYSLARNSEPWVAVQNFVSGMDRQVYYNGDGRMVMRAHPDHISWNFRQDDRSVIVSKPTLNYDISTVRNVVEVLGKDPAGRRPQIRAVARANPSHPLSPESLSRNGKPTVILERIENDMPTTKEAQALADRTLKNLLTAAVDISMDVMPIPHLEEKDMIGVELHGNIVPFQLKQFTIPLTVSDSMSIGSNKRISPRRRVRK